MKKNEVTDLRSHLEQMETAALDEMLRAELEKDSPDADAVRLIMAVLEDRDIDDSNYIDAEAAAAWEKYKSDMEDRKKDPTMRCFLKMNWALKVASAVLILGILFSMIPQEVKADGLLGRLYRWTDSIFEMFTPDTVNNNRVEYVFETDHPGLQQVYDAVTELGITDPVVPMWLPEGYELIECKKVDTAKTTSICVRFIDYNSTVTFMVDFYHKGAPSEFHKDDKKDVQIYEKAGIRHAIMRNNDYWIVVWNRGGVECSMNIDCQEDTLYRILESIYVMEDSK